jgi:hypothetical protein
VDECKPLLAVVQHARLRLPPLGAGDPNEQDVLERHASAGAGPAVGAVTAAAAQPTRGRAVQVDPVKPMLKPPGTKHLKL